MLLTSIFSFSHNVLYLPQAKLQFFQSHVCCNLQVLSISMGIKFCCLEKGKMDSVIISQKIYIESLTEKLICDDMGKDHTVWDMHFDPMFIQSCCSDEAINILVSVGWMYLQPLTEVKFIYWYKAEKVLWIIAIGHFLLN